MNFRPLSLVVGASLLAFPGCRPTDACGEEGSPCGGNPIGTWAIEDWCQDPAGRAPLQKTSLGQPIVNARQPLPEPTASDWCSDLEYTPNGVGALSLPHDTFTLAGGFVSYTEAGGYSAFITSRGRAALDLSMACLTRMGVAPPAPMDGAARAAFCAKLTTDLMAFFASAPGVTDVACGASASGCLCGYTIESDAAGTALNGTWTREGNVISHHAASKVLPSDADFCTETDTLTLWGHARTNIMNMPGVRTLHLRRIVCGNGMVETLEQCDPPNATTCDPNCQFSCGNRMVQMDRGEECDPPDGTTCDTTCHII